MRRRRARRIIGAVVIALILAWLGGLIWFAGRIPPPLQPPAGETVASAAPTADAIAVLTGGSGRLRAGFDLLAAKKGQKLLVSGVYRGVDVRALLRLGRHAPAELECCVVLGYDAGDTAGNAVETARWMAREKYRSLLLVTAAYHMPRSLLVFRRAMPTIRIIPHPVHPPGFKYADWWRWPGSARLVVSEYQKYLFALIHFY